MLASITRAVSGGVESEDGEDGEEVDVAKLEQAMAGLETKVGATADADEDAAEGEKGAASEGGYVQWLSSFMEWTDEEQLISVADTYDDTLVLVEAPNGPAHFSCPLTLPPPRSWPTKPLLFRESQVHHGWDGDNKVGCPIPTTGIPFAFETALFKGHVMLRMRSLPEAASYFEGKARLSSVVISGRFKRSMPFTDAQTGQEFCKPIRQPSTFVTKAVLKFFRLLAPHLKVFIGKQTYFLSPVAQTVQAMHVGSEPVVLTPDMQVEDNFGEAVLGRPMNGVQRKKFFAKKANLAKFDFSPDNVYTFDFYNDKIDMETFRLKALGQEFDVQKYLKGQPLRILARDFKPGNPSNFYLWNFEVWHQRAADHLPDASDRDADGLDPSCCT